jgi:hypothetical protein
MPFCKLWDIFQPDGRFIEKIKETLKSFFCLYPVFGLLFLLMITQPATKVIKYAYYNKRNVFDESYT